MLKENKIIVGKSDDSEYGILLNKANRHGLITGATGSGKTITTKVMAEGFSSAGIPVFMADVKGDLASFCTQGESNDNITSRLEKLNITDFDYDKYPVHFWDVFGKSGHPIRTTVKNIGPDILSIMLGLTEAQEGNLNILFKVCEDEGLDLVDLKDLKLALQYIADNRKDYITKYGNITSQSIGVIQRSLLTLENQGGENFFGEPALDIKDFISFDPITGKGYINVLHAVELFKSPDLYASFLLWLLVELYNTLPEVGDTDKPKVIFFFDEAHLLFGSMPSYRLKKIIQLVKLFRSKGLGLYFVSQRPTDIPDEIISQLGNRVQHTLNAYTPSEQKIVQAAANAFRTNKKFDTKEAILSLGNGEALVSFQTESGEPEIVEKVTVLPPQSKIGTIDDGTRTSVINNSNLVGKYDEKIDNESAYEKISAKYEEQKKLKEEEERKAQEEKEAKEAEKQKQAEEKQKAKEEREAEKAKKNSVGYKLGKKVANKTVDKVINKGLNSIFKNLFK